MRKTTPKKTKKPKAVPRKRVAPDIVSADPDPRGFLQQLVRSSTGTTPERWRELQEAVMSDGLNAEARPATRVNCLLAIATCREVEIKAAKFGLDAMIAAGLAQQQVQQLERERIEEVDMAEGMRRLLAIEPETLPIPVERREEVG